MLYAILCYNDEAATTAWTPEKDAEVMAALGQVEARIAAEGRLGPVARLAPTRRARTLRKDQEPVLLVDGPFAETKEQLLGFFVIDCDDDAHAEATARELGRANPGGAYEIRPLDLFRPGDLRA